MAHDAENSQTAWKRDCDRVQRRSNKQKIVRGRRRTARPLREDSLRRHLGFSQGRSELETWRGSRQEEAVNGLMLGKIAAHLSFSLLGFSICYGIHNAGLFEADPFYDRAVDDAERSIEHAEEKTESSLDLAWRTKLPRTDIEIDSWRCKSGRELRVVIDCNRLNGRSCGVTKILHDEWDISQICTPDGWKIQKTAIEHDRKTGTRTKETETGLDPSTRISLKQRVKRALVRQD